MPDQATALRELVSRCARRQVEPGVPPPRLVAVAGSQVEVGCTTLAWNLAVAARRAGHSVLLLDADLRHGDLTRRCGLRPRGTLADVLTTRKLFEEVILSGPGGVQIVPSGTSDEVTLPAARRLVEQLPALRRFADLLVVDLGTFAESLAPVLLPLAAPLLLVATPDAGSILDTYSLVKSLAGEEIQVPLKLIVNRAADAGQAERVHERLDRCCREFLSRGLEYAGCVPADRAVAEAAQCERTLLTEFADSPSAQAIARLAEPLFAREPFTHKPMSGRT